MTTEELKREYVKGWYVLADRYRQLAADYRRQADELERQAIEAEKTLLGDSQAQETAIGGGESKVPTLMDGFGNPFQLTCPHCHGIMSTKIVAGKRTYHCYVCNMDYSPQFK